MEGATLAPPYVTTRQLAEMWGTKVETLRTYARRAQDPLPIRYIDGRVRGGFLAVAELEPWVERNTHILGEQEPERA